MIGVAGISCQTNLDREKVMAAAARTLAARYDRIREQLAVLCQKQRDPIARMATVAALLHHKQPHFFWTGFYRLLDGKLVVGPYQGPLACAVLPGPDGVCWAAVQRGEPVLVPDVHEFPGHVACDSRSRSEVVVPVRDRSGLMLAVLDVDSERPAAFSAVDVAGLEAIAALVYGE
jgi:GAF domain-containing protein